MNRNGVGSFAGLPSLPSVVQFEFRRAFESARDGASYSGDPFEAPSIGPVSVLAEPVTDEDGLIGVVEALVSWDSIRREFADETRRDVRATLVDRHGREPINHLRCPFFRGLYLLCSLGQRDKPSKTLSELMT